MKLFILAVIGIIVILHILYKKPPTPTENGKKIEKEIVVQKHLISKEQSKQVEEVIESTEEGVELDLTDTEQNVEAVEDGSEKADPAKEEPAEEIELPDEVVDSEEDSDLNIEEK